MVLRVAPSRRSRKSKFKLSSTTQMVTCTPRFCASASAVATIALMVAELSTFRVDNSAGRSKDVNSSAVAINFAVFMISLLILKRHQAYHRAKSWRGVGNSAENLVDSFDP